MDPNEWPEAEALHKAERKVIEAAEALDKKLDREHANIDNEVAAICHAVEAMQAVRGK